MLKTMFNPDSSGGKKIGLLLAIMLFTASLAFAQWVVDEGFETSVPPSGWIEYQVTGSNSWAQTSSRANTGTYSAFFNDFSGDNDVWLITPVSDLSGMTSPKLKYWENVHYGSWADSHNVKYSTDYSGSGDPTLATWTTLNSTIGTEDTWVEKEFNLPTSATVYVAFQYVGNYASEWYIDDVKVGQLPAHDFATLDHAEDSRSMQDTTVLVNENVTFHIVAKNWGTTTESSPIKWTCTGGSPTSDTDESTGSLAQDATEHHTFSPTWSASTAGTYTVKFYTDLATDTDHSNDTTEVQITVLANHSYPLTEDFESDFDKFDNAPGNDVDWTISTTYHHGGSKCAYNDYTNSDENILHETGVLDLSSTTAPRLYFWHIAKTEGTYDKCYVEISTDAGQTYTKLPASCYLGSASDYSTREYFHEDSYTIWGTGDETPDNATWWKQETFDLGNYKQANVRIRFRLYSDYSTERYGWLLDDIEVKEAPAGAIIGLNISSHDFCCVEVGSSDSVEIVISNTGGSNLVVTGATVASPFSCPYSGTIPPSESDTTFAYFSPTTPCHYSETLTFNSNATSGDSTVALSGCAYPSNSASEGFEGASFPPDGWSATSYWYQTSTYSHSGTYSAYCWYYATNDTLMTPRLDLSTGGPYKLCFWWRESSTNNPDSTIVRFSNDGGTNWTQLGVVGKGNSSTWECVCYAIPTTTSDNCYIMWNYVGDGSYSSYNFYLDDVIYPPQHLGPPQAPTNPNPGNGDTDVSNTADLGWTNGYQTDNIDLYFSTDSSKVATKDASVRVITGQNVETYDPGTMAYSTKYFWKVICKNSAKAETDGPLWKFTVQDDPNYGQGTGTPLYYFANSLATSAPSHPSYSWIDISGTGTDVIGTVDGDSKVGGPYSIGFDFNFFGTNYNQFWIAADGYICFSSITSSEFTNQHIPSTSGVGNIVALFWDDMNPGDTDVLDRHIYYGTSGGNMVITYLHLPEYGADTNGWITAQIILKPNGNIKLQYKEHGSSIDLNGATIGIENSAEDAGVEYRYNTDGGPIFGSPLAVEFGTDSGTLPVELIAGSLTAEYAINEYGSEYVVISWATASETDVNGFNIWRSDENDISTAIQINHGELIPGTNTSTEHTYTYQDETIGYEELHAGDIYYYWLEVVELGGISSYSDAFEFVVPDNYEPPVPPELPLKIGLYQNCPNPFNPGFGKTKICFYLGEGTNANVEIKVYNIKGELVKTIWNQYTEFEKHPVPAVWDGCDENGTPQASGLYFYRMKVDDKVKEIKKMLVIR